MLFGHGSGILPFGLNDDNTFRTKGMGGDAVKYLENREIADLTLPDYEFMIMARLYDGKRGGGIRTAS